MEFLQIKDIIKLNRETVESHGGNFVPPDNILKEGALEYLVEAVDGKMFGQPLYPTLSDKAAFYMFQTVTGHIFSDGNKRTGLAAALVFLEINSEFLQEDLIKVQNEEGQQIPSKGDNSNKILENFTLEMAEGKLTLADCALWFESNINLPDLYPSATINEF